MREFDIVTPDITTSDEVDVFTDLLKSSCEGQIVVLTFEPS